MASRGRQLLGPFFIVDPSAPIANGSLDESSRESYLRNEWKPRTRNPGPAQSEGMLNVPIHSLAGQTFRGGKVWSLTPGFRGTMECDETRRHTLKSCA